MNDINPTRRLTVIKHLASGKKPDLVATMTALTESEVLDIASHHGYPDTKKLAWAADILQGKLDEQARDSLPPAADVPTPRSPQAPRPSGADAPDRADEFRVLINAEKQAKSKRIQKLTDRVLDQLSLLAGLVRDEQAKDRERAAAEEDRRRARAEVARLEQQLADAKAKLRPGRTTTTHATGDYPCAECGETFATPQGRGAHRAKRHGYRRAS